jgi:hypothetical protein
VGWQCFEKEKGELVKAENAWTAKYTRPLLRVRWQCFEKEKGDLVKVENVCTANDL